MKHLNLFIIMLFSCAVSFAQFPRSSPEQQEAFTRLQNLYDSLSSWQKNMFLTDIKHIMDPEVTVIQPGATNSDASSDAIVLFDGTDINKEWEESEWGFGRAPGVKPAVTWVIKDGAMESGQRSGSVKTKRSFEDFQLHIEWKTPSVITGEGQGRGNSGIVIQGIYEVQILDSYNNRTYRKCKPQTRRMANL